MQALPLHDFQRIGCVFNAARRQLQANVSEPYDHWQRRSVMSELLKEASRSMITNYARQLKKASSGAIVVLDE